jgi:hypothetical protein
MNIKVYIAGPYSSDPEGNTLKAIDAADELLAAGFVPYLPHLTHYWHLRHPRPWKDWIALDSHWIPLCNAMLRLPGHSEGAKREVLVARDHAIPLFESIEELKKAYRGHND